MANLITDTTNYDAIANAIRESNGKTSRYYPSEMADAIKKLSKKLDNIVNFRNSTFNNPDLSWLDVSNRTVFDFMFSNCTNLTTLDLSTWVFRNSINSAQYMFNYCPNLTTINFGNVSNINITSHTGFAYMFDGCGSLSSLDLSFLHYSDGGSSSQLQLLDVFKECNSLQSLNVFSISDSLSSCVIADTFENCSSLTSLDLSKWNITNVSSLYRAFKGCTSLMTLDIRNWKFTNNLITYQAFDGVPSSCEIIVNSQSEKNTILGIRPDFTNVVVAQ